MPSGRDTSSGSMNQFIAVYNANGDVISNIKYYDGFMGQRIGAISCLAFHPYWVTLISPWGNLSPFSTTGTFIIYPELRKALARFHQNYPV